MLVTPPTPKLPSPKFPAWYSKTLTSPPRTVRTDAAGKLIAPLFDVAPGRQIMLAERERQATEWLEKFKAQQREHQERVGSNLRVGAGQVDPPMANVAEAEATFSTPSSPTRSTSSRSLRPAGGHAMEQHKGGPPIPLRRRSFGRQISPSLAAPATTENDITCSERSCSPIKVPAIRAVDIHTPASVPHDDVHLLPS